MNQKQTDRNNEHYRRRIEWLKQYAPKMPLDVAIQDAEKLISIENENTRFREALVILMIDILGIDDSGYLKSKEVADKVNERTRTRMAFRTAMELHTGIACSPFSGGFTSFLIQMDNDAEDWAKRQGTIEFQSAHVRETL